MRVLTKGKLKPPICAQVSIILFGLEMRNSVDTCCQAVKNLNSVHTIRSHRLCCLFLKFSCLKRLFLEIYRKLYVSNFASLGLLINLKVVKILLRKRKRRVIYCLMNAY